MSLIQIAKNQPKLSLMASLVLLKNESIKSLDNPPSDYSPLYEEHVELLEKFKKASLEDLKKWSENKPTTLMAVLCILTQGGNTNDLAFLSKVLKETENNPQVIAAAKAVFYEDTKEDSSEQESISDIQSIFG